MELNFFTDHLFDLLNESNLLDVQNILYNDKTSTFQITIYDGTVFILNCGFVNQEDLYRIQDKNRTVDKGKIISMEEVRYLIE